MAKSAFTFGVWHHWAFAGWAWAGSGGYLLYRAAAATHIDSAEDVDFTAPTGLGQAGSATAYDYDAGLAPDVDYVYAMRTVSDAGIIEEGESAFCRVRWDGADLVGMPPNALAMASAEPAAEGYIRVRAVVSATGERAKTASVVVARDSGGGPDWNNPVATISARGAGTYTALIGPYADAEGVTLSLRAEAADGAAGPQTDLAEVLADDSAPTPVGAITAVQEGT